MQGATRGMVYRLRHAKNLNALIRAKQERSYCVECEHKKATRRCLSCEDRFCGACFEKTHQKGKRKLHFYENIVEDVKEVQPKTDIFAGIMDDGPLWEEYWDDSAQAKYWYNVQSGEAVWIKPKGI